MQQLSLDGTLGAMAWILFQQENVHFKTSLAEIVILITDKEVLAIGENFRVKF